MLLTYRRLHRSTTRPLGKFVSCLVSYTWSNQSVLIIGIGHPQIYSQRMLSRTTMAILPRATLSTLKMETCKLAVGQLLDTGKSNSQLNLRQQLLQNHVHQSATVPAFVDRSIMHGYCSVMCYLIRIWTAGLESQGNAQPSMQKRSLVHHSRLCVWLEKTETKSTSWPSAIDHHCLLFRTTTLASA